MRGIANNRNAPCVGLPRPHGRRASTETQVVEVPVWGDASATDTDDADPSYPAIGDGVVFDVDPVYDTASRFPVAAEDTGGASTCTDDDDAPLLDAWRYIETDGGQVYYYNTATGQTSWYVSAICWPVMW